MATIYAIGRNTFREAVRQPVFWAVILLTVALMVLTVAFAGFALGEESRLVRDAGLTSITIAGLLLAIFLSSSVVADEIEKKTALSVLCKPVHRQQLICGKYVGIICAIVASYLLLSIILLSTVWLYESPVRYTSLITSWWGSQPLTQYQLVEGMPASLAGKPVTLGMLFSFLSVDLAHFASTVFGNLLTGVLLSLCEVAILAAAALAVSTRLSMILNVCLIFSLFILGHQVGTLVDVLAGGHSGILVTLVHRLIPNFEFLNYASDIAFDKLVPISLVGQLALYTAGWIGIFLLLAIWLFDQREIA